MSYAAHQVDAAGIVARAAIITLSDTRTFETDFSGQLVGRLLAEAGHTVVRRDLIPDDAAGLVVLLDALRTDDALLRPDHTPANLGALPVNAGLPSPTAASETESSSSSSTPVPPATVSARSAAAPPVANPPQNRPGIDVIITTGGTGISRRDQAVDVVAGRLTTPLPGFGELFRMLSWEQIGSGAMLSRATGGVDGRQLLFALPGSKAAVELAMTRLILPELAHLLRELRK